MNFSGFTDVAIGAGCVLAAYLDAPRRRTAFIAGGAAGLAAAAEASAAGRSVIVFDRMGGGGELMNLGTLVDYPDAERELKILRAKVPQAPASLSAQIVAFVQALRQQDLFKQPGVAETLDWAAALSELDAVALDPALVSDTLGVLLKYQDDIAKIEGSKVASLLSDLKAV